MKSVVALTLAVFCLSMLVDFGTCGILHETEEVGRALSVNFELLASGLMDALQIFVRGAVTAGTLAKFVIDALNVFVNAGLF